MESKEEYEYIMEYMKSRFDQYLTRKLNLRELNGRKNRIEERKLARSNMLAQI